jgi:hypothetical protein
MRVAVIVIGIVMVSTPSYASKSCMSLGEARQQLGQVHLFWHGSGHCWDASAGRHGLLHRSRQAEVRQAQRDDAEPAEDKAQDQEKPHGPKWRDARDAMSEMLPADAPVFRSATALPMTEPSLAPLEEGPNWLDRWVDIVQIFPRIEVGHAAAPTAPPPAAKVEPLVTPVRLILAFLAIILTIGVIEILFRSAVHEYRR